LLFLQQLKCQKIAGFADGSLGKSPENAKLLTKTWRASPSSWHWNYRS